SHGYDLAVLELVHVGEVVQVPEDEVEVVDLAGAPQVGRAVTPHPRIGRRIAPALDQLGGGPVLRGIPRVEQPPGDLGTAHLIFFAELPTARGPQHRDAAVPAGQPTAELSAVTEAPEIRRPTPAGSVEQGRAGRRYQHHGSIDVGAARQLGWAVPQLEPCG